LTGGYNSSKSSSSSPTTQAWVGPSQLADIQLNSFQKNPFLAALNAEPLSGLIQSVNNPLAIVSKLQPEFLFMTSLGDVPDV
jgi:hypothetical protein